MPHDFLCPISLELMTGPVICLQSGQTYDYDFISQWLRAGGPPPHLLSQRNDKEKNAAPGTQNALENLNSLQMTVYAGGIREPLTGEPLSNPVVLRPHVALQHRIAIFCARHGVPYTPRRWQCSSGKETARPLKKWLQSFRTFCRVTASKYARSSWA